LIYLFLAKFQPSDLPAAKPSVRNLNQNFADDPHPLNPGPNGILFVNPSLSNGMREGRHQQQWRRQERRHHRDPIPNTIGAASWPIQRVIAGESGTFEIWDTALVPIYTRDAKGALLTFSVSDRDSFESITR
jgi:hypothetical protein